MRVREGAALGSQFTRRTQESSCNAEDLGSIPGSGRYPGEGRGYPLQYPGLENSMNCTVRGVTESWTQLSHFTLHEEVVLPSAVLWRVNTQDPECDGSTWKRRKGQMAGGHPQPLAVDFVDGSLK